MKQDMMGWQWHHADHVQIICLLVRLYLILCFHRPGR